VLELADIPRALAELMGPSGRTDRTKFRDQVLRPLLEAGLIEMTIPEKPRSSKQQYRVTDAGRSVLATTRKA
jgi:ATP-dependent DNA helicase RecG